MRRPSASEADATFVDASASSASDFDAAFEDASASFASEADAAFDDASAAPSLGSATDEAASSVLPCSPSSVSAFGSDDATGDGEADAAEAGDGEADAAESLGASLDDDMSRNARRNGHAYS